MAAHVYEEMVFCFALSEDLTVGGALDGLAGSEFVEVALRVELDDLGASFLGEKEAEIEFFEEYDINEFSWS